MTPRWRSELSAMMSIHLFICHFYDAVRERTSAQGVGVGEIQHLTVGTMWNFIGALLLLPLPGRHQGHKDTEGQSGWPPLTRVVKVDKLAADGGERAQPGSLSHTFRGSFSRSAFYLFSPPRLWEGRDPGLLRLHGAAVLAGAWKSSPSPG